MFFGAKKEKLDVNSLAVVIHELKNPLSAIFGYADLLLDTEISNGLSVEQKAILVNLKAAASRTINTLRNYQSLEQLGQKIKKSELSKIKLNSLIENLVDSIWKSNNKNVTIILNLQDEDLKVLATEFHLERIISNLISNAIKFSDTGGQVDISTKKDGKYAKITIYNTGTSISKEEVKTIFHKNTRGANSVGTSGSGLGLFVAAKSAESLKARIVVKSIDEQGTSFSVILPLQRK